MNKGLTVRGSGRALLLAFALGWSALAASQVAVPPLTGHVTDQTGTLTRQQMATLEQTLTAFEARKGSQLAVLMVALTTPEEVEKFALRVAEKWKLGRRRVDDGAILVVAKNDRAVRIEVGYGVEGALNDLTSKRIISETILPRFKALDFYGRACALHSCPRCGRRAARRTRQRAWFFGHGRCGRRDCLVRRRRRVDGLGRRRDRAVRHAARWSNGRTRYGRLGGYYGAGGRGGGGGGGFSGGGGGFGGGGASGRW